MKMLIIPEVVSITVKIAVDPDLLALLQQIVDQRSDRAKAAQATTDLKASTGALASAIPSQPT
jgi:hypothetical protein